MKWAVHHDGKVREWSESTLRNKLKSSKLTGVELVREPGSKSWRPLHSTPLFQEVVPHLGNPKDTAMSRVYGSFIGHLTVFCAVIAGFTVATGAMPSWAGWWGIGLIMHGANTLKTIQRVNTQKTTTAPRTESPIPLPDSEVITAIDELTASGWSGDADALKTTATELARRRDLVDDTTNDTDRTALLTEKDTVLGQREHADASTQLLLDDQLAAIAARLSFLDDVRRLSIRLNAQERTFLHQIESLRLGQIQSADTAKTTDLEASVTRLRRELEAESEVTDALARARRSHRPVNN